MLSESVHIDECPYAGSINAFRSRSTEFKDQLLQCCIEISTIDLMVGRSSVVPKDGSI